MIDAAPVSRAVRVLRQRAQLGAWKPSAAIAPRGPVTLAVVLPAPIEASAVLAPDERFRCVPYNATFSGATCVARQEVARLQLAQRGKPGKPGLQGDYSECRECPVGAGIRNRLTS